MTDKPTPAADWREAGEADPHPWYEGKQREDLGLGTLTDDQLANAVFLYADQQPSMQEIIAGTAMMPIVYTTAAKDRIRWLSRRNEANAAKVERLAAAMRDLVACSLDDQPLVDNYHKGRDVAQIRADGDLPRDLLKAEALLAEMELLT